MKSVKILLLAVATLCALIALCACGGGADNTPEHTHSFGEWETTKAPTCSTDGEQTRFCDCGEIQSKNIPALAHTIVVDKAIAPTCTSIGLTEGKHCDTCGEVIIAQIEIAKLEHTYSGDFDTTCEECGYTRVVDCDHPTLTTLPAKAATCVESGLTEGKLCSHCGTVLIPQTVVPTLEHDYNTAYSFDNNFHWYACKNCGAKKDSAEHKVADNGMCSVCDMPVGATEGIIYETSADGTYAEVVAYEGTTTKIRIADTYNGLPVTTIYSQAFYQNGVITSVIIPDSVTSIGYRAFSACTSLASVVIPDSVTSIGSSAFSHCDSLTSVVIPDSVTSIGDHAFAYCFNLTSVVIPDSVTSIGDSAFWGCDSLTSVVIPDSVTSIGDYAFAYCYSLTGIKVDSNNANYKDINGNLYTKDGKTLIQYAIGKSDTHFVIPNSVTSIGSYAFAGCSSLTGVVIPDSVTSIGDDAFHGCSSLESVVIPDSVTSIGGWAFYDCSSLESVVIPDSVTSIGGWAFYDCSNLQFNEYENCKYLGSKDNPYYALIEVTTQNLSSYTIHEDTKVIADYAFASCSRLTSVVIPDSVTSIGDYAFWGCTGLTSIVIPDSVTSIGYAAFDLTGLKDVYITDIDAWCNISFSDYYSNPMYNGANLYLNGNLVTEVTVPDTVNGLEYTFCGCKSIVSVTIPDSVTSISGYAFYNCDGLTSIVIPDSVTSIGDYAFHNCTRLTDVYYTGTEAEWAKISIDSSNWYLTNATIHYNYVPAN